MQTGKEQRITRAERILSTTVCASCHTLRISFDLCIMQRKKNELSCCLQALVEESTCGMLRVPC